MFRQKRLKVFVTTYNDYTTICAPFVDHETVSRKEVAKNWFDKKSWNALAGQWYGNHTHFIFFEIFVKIMSFEDTLNEKKKERLRERLDTTIWL